MKNFKSYLSIGFSFVLCNFSHADLATRYEEEKAAIEAKGSIESLGAGLQSDLSKYDFIMVDGIFGDLTQGLYGDVVTFLKSEIPQSGIKVIRPSTALSIEENAAVLTNELRIQSRPKVIIAHSRGAAELFLALLKSPDLLAGDNIAKVILVQGAFSGTPVAELVSSLLNKSCSRIINPIQRAYCEFVEAHSNALKALVPIPARQIRAPLQNNMSKDDQKMFQEKVYFVKSRSSFKSVHPTLWASAAYLKREYSAFENDGLLLTLQQKVTHFGQDLGTLEADHVGLLKDSRLKPYQSRAFMKALLTEIFSE
jgi:hypothetical protein